MIYRNEQVEINNIIIGAGNFTDDLQGHSHCQYLEGLFGIKVKKDLKALSKPYNLTSTWTTIQEVKFDIQFNTPTLKFYPPTDGWELKAIELFCQFDKRFLTFLLALFQITYETDWILIRTTKEEIYQPNLRTMVVHRFG